MYYPTGVASTPLMLDSSTPKTLERAAVSNSSDIKLMGRFLSSFECLRSLPSRFQLELALKLQCRIVSSNQLLDTGVLGTDTGLVIVLSGALCVHKTESVEDAHLRMMMTPLDAKSRRATGGESGASYKERANLQTSRRLCCTSSSHICTLQRGACFGETGVLFEHSDLFANMSLMVSPTASQSSCAVLILSLSDLRAVQSQWLDALDYAPVNAHAVFMNCSPRDRTSEQISFLVEYFRRVSPARVFFGQFPLRVLRQLCAHATLERHDSSCENESCIQREGTTVNCLRIILNGYVAVFKNSRQLVDHEKDTASKLSLQPHRHVLKRDQSWLIHSSADTSARSSQNSSAHILTALSKRDSAQLLAKNDHATGTADPIGILPFGSCFGQLQVFTESKSPYSYVAYSSGMVSSPYIHVLIVSDRIAKLCFSNIDEFVVYNPVRILRRVVKANENAIRSQQPLKGYLPGIGLERLLSNQPTLAGIPRSRLDTAVSSMQIVHVHARRFVYEAGERARGVVFVVLAGTVRLFSYASSSPRNDIADRLPAMKLPMVVTTTNAKIKSISSSSSSDNAEPNSLAFDRTADDVFFAQSYASTQELSAGEAFGCFGELAFDQGCAFSPTPRQSPLPRASVGAYFESGGGIVYPNTAVAITDCQIGVLFLNSCSTRHPAALSREERAQVMDMYGDLVSTDAGGEGPVSMTTNLQPPRAFSDAFLALGIKIVERMDLGGRMSSAQRIQLVKQLKYGHIPSGQQGLYSSIDQIDQNHLR